MGFFHTLLSKLVEEKRIEEELKIIDDVIRSNPENPIGWRIKGGILYQLRRFEESIKAHDEVIKRDPDRADAWNYKGLALFELKRYEEAIRMFDEGLKRDPDNLEIRAMREHLSTVRKNRSE